jgi:glutathione S-transferase
MLEALMVASTDVTPIFGAYFAVVRAKEPHAPTAQMFKDRLRAFFKVWDELLGKRKHCAGGEVSVADFSLYAGVARIKGVAPDVLEGFPNVARWAAEMASRPAIQRATA